MEEKIALLQSLLGIGVRANRDFYQYYCPFCNHYKRKLGVSIEHGYWHCWVCKARGTKITSLLNRLTVNETLASQIRLVFKVRGKSQHNSSNSVNLPKEYLPLWIPNKSHFRKMALNYLTMRNVRPADVIKHSIGYCEDGKYHGYLIFPNYDEHGVLTYYTGRSFIPKSKFPHIGPTNANKNNIIGDDLLINWDDPIILVESKLDAITIRRNAIPLFGKQMSFALQMKIIECGVDTVYLCLDGDAHDSIMSQSEFFLTNGITVYMVPLQSNEDPASIGYEEIWQRIHTATRINEFQSFEFKIKSKLG